MDRLAEMRGCQARVKTIKGIAMNALIIGFIMCGCTIVLVDWQMRIIGRLDRLIEIASDHPPEHEPSAE